MKIITRAFKPDAPSCPGFMDQKSFGGKFESVDVEISNEYVGWMEDGTSPGDVVITIDGKEYLFSVAELLSAIVGFRERIEIAQADYIAHRQAMQRTAVVNQPGVRGGYKPL